MFFGEKEDFTLLLNGSFRHPENCGSMGLESYSSSFDDILIADLSRAGFQLLSVLYKLSLFPERSMHNYKNVRVDVE